MRVDEKIKKELVYDSILEFEIFLYVFHHIFFLNNVFLVQRFSSLISNVEKLISVAEKISTVTQKN